MADEILQASELLNNAFEPKRSNRWVLQDSGLDAFTLRTCTRPAISFEEIEIPYINGRRYIHGKAMWEPMSFTLNDPITPSAAQKVMEWVRLQYETITGRSGYQAFSKRDFDLKILDPTGIVVEHWRILGAFLQNASFGDLDYGSSEPIQISVTTRFDQALLMY